MTAAAIGALFVAGVVGGIVSVLVSLVSLVTYPALLAVGLLLHFAMVRRQGIARPL